MEINVKRLTEDEFKKFAKLIYEASGIYLKEAKLTLLSNRLRKRLNALKLSEFSDYYKHVVSLSGDAKKKEYEELLDVVSTNETYFFRNERHFDALMNNCLPEIVKNKKEKKLRIWSSACSTGEEPYTIAICLLEKKALLNGWQVEIIATDIAPSVLAFAKVGEYSGRRIEKVPAEYLKKYFIPKEESSGVYMVKDELKRMVKFSYLNFFKDPYPKNLDIIFCRNVMIYFDREHQKYVVDKFVDSISPDGYLFIGHSETLHSISDNFEYRKIGDAPVYVPVKEKK